MWAAVFCQGGMGEGRMYNRFFGFSENPFRVTADPVFLYLNPGLREMLAALISGISDRRGLMTIVGDSGTGKTTLLNAMLDRLDEKIKVARISNTNITFEEMLNSKEEYAPGADKLTMDSPPPLPSDPDGKYPVPQPGIVTQREY